MNTSNLHFHITRPPAWKAFDIACLWFISSICLADWCFDYHQSRITLYHESTVKINFETGDYAKSHLQFANRKMKPLDVIDYIAAHDAWRAEKNAPH